MPTRTLELDYTTASTLLEGYLSFAIEADRLYRDDVGSPHDYTNTRASQRRHKDMLVKLIIGLPVTVTESDLRSADDDREAARQAAFGSAVTAFELPDDDTEELAELVHNVA